MSAEPAFTSILSAARTRAAELAYEPLPPHRPRALRSLHAALARAGACFIYECKRRSPSAGRLYGDRPLASLFAAYDGFADAISVVVEPEYFGGAHADLFEAASQSAAPVLCKDFVVDPVQVRAAHAYGADAVLLMLSVLDDAEYRACAAEAQRLGLETLTEIHTVAELERALTLDAQAIGINNRDFNSLAVDIETTRRLAPRVPRDRIVVCESGIGTHADIRSLAPLVDAFLVGTTLLRAPATGLTARELAFGEVKVCGLTRPDDARAAWRAGARWGGLVFAPGSPRQVDREQAAAIAGASPLPLVGVFTGAAPETVAAHARTLELAAVQLHGDGDDQLIEATRAALPPGCALWRALRVDRSLPETPTGVDRVLYDCATPGTGTRFDWSLLPGPERMARCGLAGGIDAGNIADALATGAGLIDVSTGLEFAPGMKSVAKLDGFFDAIRIALQQRR